MLKTRLKSCGVIYITFGKSYWLGWKHIKPSNQGRGWIRVSIMLVVRMSCPRWIAFSDYHIKLSNAVNKLRPRPHVYVFMRKWRLFCSFSPSVYTQTLIQRFRKSPFSPETETFENGFESGDFRKRRLLKTVLIWKRIRVDVAIYLSLWILRPAVFKVAKIKLPSSAHGHS